MYPTTHAKNGLNRGLFPLTIKVVIRASIFKYGGLNKAHPEVRGVLIGTPFPLNPFDLH